MLALSTFVAFASLSQVVDDGYRLVEIGSLGPGNASSLCVAETGTVVGQSDSKNGPVGFVWAPSVMKALLSPGLASSAEGINDVAFSVGWITMPDGRRRAAGWRNSQIVQFGTLGGKESQAFAVNNKNIVVGWAHDEMGRRRAFVWFEGTLGQMTSQTVPMEYVGGRPALPQTAGEGKSSAGSAGGGASSSSGGFSSSGGNANSITMMGIGNECIAYDISDNNLICGTAQNSNGVWKAFLFKDDMMLDLGIGDLASGSKNESNNQQSSQSNGGPGWSSSSASASASSNASSTMTVGGPSAAGLSVNSSGVVVGWIEDLKQNRKAVIWRSPGIFEYVQGLEDSTWSEARGINEEGIVVGTAKMKDGSYRGFVVKNGMTQWLRTQVVAANDINNRGQIAVDLQKGNSIIAGLLAR